MSQTIAAPHEALYDELLAWVLSKEGVNEPEDIIEAIGQMFAASIVAIGSDSPMEQFKNVAPKLEAMISEMWAQSAEEPQ